MDRKGICLISLFLILVIPIGMSVAETTGHEGVNPEKIKASFGFGQFNLSVGQIFDPSMTLLLFGSRGGGYVEKSETFYMGGGGRGGFTLTGLDGGFGYGFFHAGWRGPLGGRSLGMDYYGGFGLGGYGSEDASGTIFGPVIGVGLFYGTNTSFDYGIFLETAINVLDINTSMITLGIHTGGKSGGLSVAWEDRHDLDL